MEFPNVMVLVKKPLVFNNLLLQKVMQHTIVKIFFLFHSLGSIQSWVFPPGIFLNEFASMHDRASITVYLPSTNVYRKLIVNNQKSATFVNVSNESKLFVDHTAFIYISFTTAIQMKVVKTTTECLLLLFWIQLLPP